MATTPRPLNDELCKAFRALLTDGAKEALDENTLAITKEWRGKLWKTFREIEDRLCPLEAIARERDKHEPD